MNQEEQIIFNRKQAVYSFQAMICKEVMEYATQSGIKQEMICKALRSQNINMTRQIFYQLKTGKYTRQLSIYTLAAICEVVGKSLNDFAKIPDRIDG